MHVDERGVWSANVTWWGAWAAGLGYTFDHLMRAPAQFQPRRRMIERGGPWFSLVEVELPVAEHRAVPLSLQLAGITGTWASAAIEDELFLKADLVVFYADLSRALLDRTQAARAELDRRLDGQPVVFQLDRPYGAPEDMVPLEELRTVLALGDRPVVETHAYGQQLTPLFKVIVEQLLAARDRLPRRKPFEP